MKGVFVPAFGLMLWIGSTGLAFAQANTMSDDQIKKTVESQGYTDVRVTGHDKDHVDVKATKNGKTEKLAVDPKTGQTRPDTDEDHDND